MYHSENDNTKEERSNEGNEVKRESEPKDHIKASDTNEEDVVFKESIKLRTGKIHYKRYLNVPMNYLKR